MKVIGAVNAGQVERVATAVSLGVLAVNSGGSVEWLVNVSEVVDQQSEGVRFGLVFVAYVALDGLVDERALVVAGSREPVLDCGDHSSDVIVIEFELGVVVDGPALIQKGGVNEVPA